MRSYNHPSPLSHMDDDRSSSPKRKKIRQKYAPKACVSCRRSKLKCTGENPCQRCVDNGKRCFYSEDQTAAEVLQNLSRPTPAPPSLPSYSNGNGASRRNIMPRTETVERRASDASVMGMTLEGRMARIEAMMEALMQDRGLAFTPSGSIEREGSEGFRSESAFSMPILDPIHPALDQLGQPSPERMLPPTLVANIPIDADSTTQISAGSRMLPFPNPEKYQRYVAHFFGDVHLHHPCVDEVDFDTRTQRVVTEGATEPSDIYFLGLCYAVFACCDAVLEVSSPATSNSSKPPGWHWYQMADEVIDKNIWLNGDSNLTLIRCLLFQAIYLTYADLPALAYNAIRATCTAVLEQNLHQQTTWDENSPEQIYWRLCVFWSVYITDRFISTSCGRPTSFRIEEVDVELPGDFYSRAALPTQSHDLDPKHYISQYLRYETWSAQLAVDAFTAASKGHFHNSNDSNKTVDLAMQQFVETELPELLVPHSPPQHGSNSPLKIFMALRRLTIPLLVGRRAMASFLYDTSHAQPFIELATYVLRDVRELRSEAIKYASCRHQLTSAVTGVLLVFGALVLRDLSPPDLTDLQSDSGEYIENFMDAAALLSDLAQGLSYAKRVQEDCLAIISAVTAIIDRWHPLPHAQKASHGWSLAVDMIPPGIIEQFPYQALCPPLQGLPTGVLPAREGIDPRLGSTKSGVLWLF